MRRSVATRKWLEAENAKYPEFLIDVAPEFWPAGHVNPKRFRVMRSRNFLVQIFNEEPTLHRISVMRSTLKRGTGTQGTDWADDISWEELQNIKGEAGYAGYDAVEIYPRDEDIVNVANMRHLWVFLTGKLPYAWRTAKPLPQPPTEGERK